MEPDHFVADQLTRVRKEPRTGERVVVGVEAAPHAVADAKATPPPVVAGTALAFMGVTYYVIPLIFRKQVAFYPLARIQPYLFAAGMLVFSVTMTFAGTFGVPRRHWDITFSGAPFDVQYAPAVDLLMGVMALGGLLAAVGGAIYILITVWSVFFGKPLPAGAPATGVPPGIVQPPKRLGPVTEVPRASGTLILVFVFLAAFIVYYFVNWKLLSFLWRIG